VAVATWTGKLETIFPFSTYSYKICRKKYKLNFALFSSLIKYQVKVIMYAKFLCFSMIDKHEQICCLLHENKSFRESNSQEKIHKVLLIAKVLLLFRGVCATLPSVFYLCYALFSGKLSF